ncbi:MAG TPA: tetratricopeptide repeat protein, partial [Micromonosporaceae bacterium]
NVIARASEDPALRRYSWQLALSMQPFLHRLGYWADWVTLMTTALGAATEAEDRVAEAQCHRSLAGAFHVLGRNDQAVAELGRVRQLFDELGYTDENGKLEANFGWVREEQRRYEDAVAHFQRAVELFEQRDDRSGTALAMLGIGQSFGGLGKHRSAAETIERAIEIYRELDDRSGQGHGWDRLATVCQAEGDLVTAADYYQRAIELHRLENNTTAELNCHVQLGDIRHALGDDVGARAYWSTALAGLTELHLPKANAVRDRLSELDGG